MNKSTNIINSNKSKSDDNNELPAKIKVIQAQAALALEQIRKQIDNSKSIKIKLSASSLSDRVNMETTSSHNGSQSSFLLSGSQKPNFLGSALESDNINVPPAVVDYTNGSKLQTQSKNNSYALSPDSSQYKGINNNFFSNSFSKQDIYSLSNSVHYELSKSADERLMTSKDEVSSNLITTKSTNNETHTEIIPNNNHTNDIDSLSSETLKIKEVMIASQFTNTLTSKENVTESITKAIQTVEESKTHANSTIVQVMKNSVTENINKMESEQNQKKIENDSLSGNKSSDQVIGTTFISLDKSSEPPIILNTSSITNEKILSSNKSSPDQVNEIHFILKI